MKITQLSICGFRNIGKTSITMKPITALVSLNSYGKSNIFAAIDFALSFMHASPAHRKSMMHSIAAMPLNKHIDETDFTFSIEGEYDDGNEAYAISYGFSFEWAKNNDQGARIVSENLHIRERKARSHEKALMQRNGSCAKLRPSASGRCSADFDRSIGKEELVLDILSTSCPGYMKGIVSAVAGIKAYIDEQLDASFLFQRIPQIVFHSDNGRELLSENIPQSLFLLREKEPMLYSSLMDIFLSLFPDITDIEIIESDISRDLKSFSGDSYAPFTISPKLYSLWVKDRNMNQPLDFRFLSAGAKRILMLLVHIADARLNGISIVGLEEPENSIHPALFNGFLETLENLTGDMRIIVTSHSPYVLQYLDFSGIYIGMPSDDGVARFRTFASSQKIRELMSDAEDSDTLAGDYIFELLSGNDSERNILASYLENANET